MYGTGLGSNAELWDNYGYVCSDTGDPCTVATEATDCPGGTCDRPIDDNVFEETNGYVMAGVRYAGYTQAFGYYDGLCTGGDPVELFNVTTTGYLFRCSAESQNPGASCIVDGDCPDGTCDPLYDSLFLIGGGTAVMGFYCDPSGIPQQWYSQPELNVDGNNDHLWTFRAPDYTPSSPGYLLAWEDLNLGDADYNDLVVITGHLEPSAVECCVVDDDCDDGIPCTDDTCVDSVCQYTPNDALCDDAVDCTEDICNATTGCENTPNDALCDDAVDCTEDVCNATTGCEYTPNDALCDDLNVCTDDSCDSILGCQFIPNNDPCDDGLSCTHPDSCSQGACVGTPNNGDCDDLNVCTDDICDPQAIPPGTGCTYQDNTDPCDDGLYCTGADTCSGGNCSVHEGEPCDDGNSCTDDTCHEDLNICTSICNVTSTTHVDPCCSDPACSSLPICQYAGVANIGDFWANCGDVGVKIDICLQNLEIPVGGFQMDLCEDIDDCLVCTECELTERTVVFDCMVNELENGCCRVILFAKHPGGLINPGECNIVRIVYEISDAPECCDICIGIDGENIVISDEYGYEITGAIGDLGAVCPFVCGDVYPGESSPGAGDCGDGVIDLFDILEEVAFAIGTDTPDDCQGNPTGPRDDVPTGTPIILPAQCLPPNLQIDVLDVMVIIDMGLDRQDCCSYYYGGTII